MAMVMATFTDQAQAQLAASRLREAGFGEVTVGMSDDDAGAYLGLGETVEWFRIKTILVSTLGGMVTIGALGGLLGLIYGVFPENRNMGVLANFPTTLAVALTWLGVALVIGIVLGFLAGIPVAYLLGSAAEKAAARGEIQRRPLVSASAPTPESVDTAFAVIKTCSPFEIARVEPPTGLRRMTVRA
ncbi:hypothetical protein EYB53_003215 [Candidatus Chloroploca sp. M-50]|uniref:Permease n=1 Tax=Candidatus Chloroploca mongolica TaxID=2528176 RepID=A0ABS4D5L6_9CHLR|nr:hypothetical protein [Candidatus Chloroploca mongolica]MBP1464713.1 hypothetical protein [Candidatus Chloroploca mongolica]